MSLLASTDLVSLTYVQMKGTKNPHTVILTTMKTYKSNNIDNQLDAMIKIY
jgi:hypothetical protein